MKRVRMVVAYDGTNYHGWQIQPDKVTIESTLNEALTRLLGEPIEIIGASRTDSGVHARGNVAVFDTENRMPPDRICLALNQSLPADIRVQSTEEVSPDWHPRRRSCIKTYEYKILNSRIEMPVHRLYAYHCYFNLDIDKMQEAAHMLEGEHDFKSFCNTHAQVESTVRTIYRVTVSRGDEDIVRIRVTGSGFLYNMVRIIAGTLLQAGTGQIQPEDISRILEARDRRASGPTAPAKGLTLVELKY